MKKGMVTSIEPGLYRPGKWGIRIENLAANQAVAAPQETEFGSFLCFETLTLCPIDTRLMDTALMTDGEIDWVNRYHAEVRRRLEPLTEARGKSVADQTHRTAGALNSTAQKCRLKALQTALVSQNILHRFHLAASKYSGLTKSGQGDEAAESTNSTELIHLVLQHLRESFSLS